MNLFGYIIANIVETLLRGFPFPSKRGLIKIGNPDRNSPVLLTCNYHLTVERVKRAVKKMDCYLLVANSRGINVWCAATGGHFTSHDVISVLKTSGIEKLVDHRNLILPQLAATGIESKSIQLKTGWKAVWGPVYAKNIPAFINSKFKKTPEMRQVKFPVVQRIEMAVMWAFPFSVITGFIIFFLWRSAVVYTIILLWVLPFLTFLFFPVYAKRLNQNKETTGFSKYTVIFDFSRTFLILWGLFILLLVGYGILAGNLSSEFIFRMGILSFIIILVLNLDLRGSTPVYKSGLHEDRLLKIVLDENKCKGAGFCEQVCPKNCYEVDKNRHLTTIIRPDQCVQCGACIVQCPFDALYFINPKGEIILPETIRKFKLNLLGKRFVKV